MADVTTTGTPDKVPDQQSRESSSIPNAPCSSTVLLVSLAGGVYLWHYVSGFESTDDAQVDVDLYPVSARISGYVQRCTWKTTWFRSMRCGPARTLRRLNSAICGRDRRWRSLVTRMADPTNAIMLPISGWLAELIGRKRFFLRSLIVFTLSSLLCRLAPNRHRFRTGGESRALEDRA